MKSIRIELTPFRIPFRRPLVSAGARLRSRFGLLVAMYDDGGEPGFGEVAPHPAAGKAGLRDARSVLSKVFPEIDSPKRLSPDRFIDRLRAMPPSAVRAGLETAYHDLAARSAGIPFCEALGGAKHTALPVNALIDAVAPYEAASEARRLSQQGFRSIKLKITSADTSAEIARITAVREAVGLKTDIRVDANGIWSVEEAVAAISKLSALGIEYVEQPVADIPGLAAVRRAVETPIAADESLTGPDALERIAEARAADLAVIKPSLLGPETTRILIGRAKILGLRVVITSTLDTSIATAAALHLAATLPGPVIPCGLATVGLLRGDLTDTPLLPRGGLLKLPGGAGLGLRPSAGALDRWRIGRPGTPWGNDS